MVALALIVALACALTLTLALPLALNGSSKTLTWQKYIKYLSENEPMAVANDITVNVKR